MKNRDSRCTIDSGTSDKTQVEGTIYFRNVKMRPRPARGNKSWETLRRDWARFASQWGNNTRKRTEVAVAAAKKTAWTTGCGGPSTAEAGVEQEPALLGGVRGAYCSEK